MQLIQFIIFLQAALHVSGVNTRNRQSCLQKCNKLNKSHLVGQLLNSIHDARTNVYKKNIKTFFLKRKFAPIGAMKTCKGNSNKESRILNLGTRFGCVVSFRAQPLQSQGSNPSSIQRVGGLGGVQSLFGRVGEEKILAAAGIRTQYRPAHNLVTVGAFILTSLRVDTQNIGREKAMYTNIRNFQTNVVYNDNQRKYLITEYSDNVKKPISISLICKWLQQKRGCYTLRLWGWKGKFRQRNIKGLFNINFY